METKDYSKLLPLEPKPEVLEWLKEQGELNGNLLLYKAAWVSLPTMGRRQMCEIVCTACGERFYEDKVPIESCSYRYPSFGYFDRERGESIGHRQSAICHCCGATCEAWHVSGVSRYGIEYDSCTVMTVELVDGRLTPIVWRYDMIISSNGVKKIFPRRLEAYVPDGKKLIRLVGFYKYFTTVTMMDHWEQKKRFTVDVSQPEYIYPFDESVIENSNFPNCKLDLYVKTKGRQVAAYLNTYAKHPNVENLVMQNLGAFFNECLQGKGYYSPHKVLPHGLLNLKASRPCDILGLTKEEYNVFRKEKWSVKNLEWYRKNRHHIRLCETSELFKYTEWELDKLINRELPCLKVINYIKKQTAKENSKNLIGISYYTDYIDMAKENGDDVTSEKTLFPQSLVKAHDNEVKRKKYKEDQTLREGFKERYKILMPLAFADEETGLEIFPAKTEKELHVEGKCLDHCVGTYAKRHSKGDTNIFFIRKTADKETPFFTLELKEDSRKTGNPEVIQNRGRHNCIRTDEVEAFEKKWIMHITPILLKEIKKNERAGKKQS